MWYRIAIIITAEGVGGGAISGSGGNSTSAGGAMEQWDRMIKQPNHIGRTTEESKEKMRDENSPYSTDDNGSPAILGTQAREMSPYHSDPEFTTIESQLETARLQEDGGEHQQEDQPMAQMPNGDQLTKGIPQGSQGKGQSVFENPNRSSTQTFMS